jgi:hypothetical protein
MNKSGSALILGLFVIVILAGLSSSFLFKQVNQSFASNRYADSTRAFWVAEAGLQKARDALPTAPSPGNLGAGTYSVSVTGINSKYYRVVSAGTVGSTTRTVEAVVSTRDVDGSKFKYGVESTVDIDFKGSSRVYGENTTQPVPAKYRDPNYYKANSAFSFANLFSYTTTELRAFSTYYNNTWPSGNITGVNWVKAPSSHFNGNVAGSGILIVEGNLRVTGSIAFDGIIYVIGELDMAGTAQVSGAVLAESAATVDTTLTGTCDVEHNATKISSALDNIRFNSPQVVSWKEIP